MTQPGESDIPTPSGNTEAYAPVETLRPLLAAFCYSKRDVPGFVEVTVQLGDWRAQVPMHELYGALDRLERVQ